MVLSQNVHVAVRTLVEGAESRRFRVNLYEVLPSGLILRYEKYVVILRVIHVWLQGFRLLGCLHFGKFLFRESPACDGSFLGIGSSILYVLRHLGSVRREVSLFSEKGLYALLLAFILEIGDAAESPVVCYGDGGLAHFLHP